MKGDIVVCASPRCDKKFVKTRYNQKCCGSASCRTLYNRHKNGEPLVPENFSNLSNGGIATKRYRRMNKESNGMNVARNVTNSVLSSAVAPVLMSAVGRGSFVGNVAASVISSAVLPMLKDYIHSGNNIQFSDITDEMNRWINEKKYWEKQRTKIERGILPIKSIGGALIGGVLGYKSVGKEKKVKTKSKSQLERMTLIERKEYKKKLKKAEKKEKKRLENAKKRGLIGGLLLGSLGTYWESTERKELSMGGQSLIDNADRKIYEADQNIARLLEEKAVLEGWVKAEILTEDEEGIYSINKKALKTVMTADEYSKLDIPKIQFKGSYRFLLSDAREKFYKLVGGLPEQGKTSYSVKFASYFAANHGKVLYLPAEQSGANADFQEVIKRVGGTGFVIDTNAHKYQLAELLATVKGYDLVILDSINDMNLSASDVKRLNDEIAIMGVMQSTKAGGFKGGQDFLHDCDKFILIDSLRASASKSRGTDPTEERTPIEISKLTW